MPENDPLPTDKPILIVSDGEAGDLVEKVVVEQDAPSPPPPAAVQPPPVADVKDRAYAGQGSDVAASEEEA